MAVIDNHRQLIGGHSVSAPHDEIVDHRAPAAKQPVLELDELRLGVHAKRRWSARAPPRPPLGVAEPATATGVGARGQVAMWRRGGLAHLGPCAEARIQPPLRLEACERVLIETKPL